MTFSRSAPGRPFRRRADLRPISRSVCSGPARLPEGRPKGRSRCFLGALRAGPSGGAPTSGRPEGRSRCFLGMLQAGRNGLPESRPLACRRADLQPTGGPISVLARYDPGRPDSRRAVRPAGGADLEAISVCSGPARSDFRPDGRRPAGGLDGLSVCSGPALPPEVRPPAGRDLDAISVRSGPASPPEVRPPDGLRADLRPAGGPISMLSRHSSGRPDGPAGGPTFRSTRPAARPPADRNNDLDALSGRSGPARPPESRPPAGGPISVLARYDPGRPDSRRAVRPAGGADLEAISVCSGPARSDFRPDGRRPAGGLDGLSVCSGPALPPEVRPPAGRDLDAISVRSGPASPPEVRPPDGLRADLRLVAGRDLDALSVCSGPAFPSEGRPPADLSLGMLRAGPVAGGPAEGPISMLSRCAPGRSVRRSPDFRPAGGPISMLSRYAPGRPQRLAGEPTSGLPESRPSADRGADLGARSV